jgi:hypothetical protein
MKQELLNSWTNLPKELKWKFAAGVQNPMCGWGYAYQYRDYQPEYKVEMNLANVRYKMTVKDQGVFKDIMKANKLTKSQKLELWAKA